MKQLILILCIILLAQLGWAQLTNEGYKGFVWGTSKSTFSAALTNCTQSYLDKDLDNCMFKADSLFLDEFPHKYMNYRFYKDSFFEINMDFDNKYLPYIIAKLSKKYGDPVIISKETNPKVKNDSFVLYEWTFGDTKVNLLKKIEAMPAWLNITSTSIKKTIPNHGEIDIEKLLFE